MLHATAFLSFTGRDTKIFLEETLGPAETSYIKKLKRTGAELEKQRMNHQALRGKAGRWRVKERNWNRREKSERVGKWQKGRLLWRYP